MEPGTQGRDSHSSSSLPRKVALTVRAHQSSGWAGTPDQLLLGLGHCQENSGSFLGTGGEKAKLGWEFSGPSTIFPVASANSVIYDEDLSVSSKWELSVLQRQCPFNQ